MPAFSPISLLILILLISAPIVVISAPEAIRLPTEDEDSNGGSGSGVCAGIKEPASCPINCFRADPVCGDDGVTYWCGCADAWCHGARAVQIGACDVGNGVTASVPGQALLLIHIVWLILLGFSMLFGLF